MPREKRELATLRFTGARFEDHGLDIDVLPELIAYKKLLVETAKEVWRRRHPARLRLPRGFDAAITIKFFELKEGSTAVPLFRELEPAIFQQLPFEQIGDEIDEAASLVIDAIDCARQDRPPPSRLPASIVPLFESFGQTLKDDEGIVLASAGRLTHACFDRQVRERILEWSSPTYEDRVDLTGEVRGTELDSATFSIRLDDGRKVRGPFTPEQERAILQALGDHESRRLRVRGIGEFLQADGSLRRLNSIEAISLVEPGAEPAADVKPSSLLSMIAKISAQVPDEDWKAVPDDLAKNLDHYLYGGKKAG